MKIVHFTPFAPCSCGLYEAARDMATADHLVGHDVHIVDTGSTFRGGEHQPGEPGKEDPRGYVKFTSADPSVARDADILIAHTGVPDPWFSINQAPIIWILHGRPAACFGPEQFGHGNSYSLLYDVARWPRTKKLVTFWEEHMPYWRAVMPEEKLVCLPAPPVDQTRFGPNGPTHDFGALGGEFNVVLADSLREDVGLFEVANGAIEYARNHRGAKFHFYGMDVPLPRCWDIIFSTLRDLGALGEIWARRPNIEEVYRAADLVLSPHKIATRVIAEALCCGTPVLAADGCRYSHWEFDITEPGDIAAAIQEAIINSKHAVSLSKPFALDNYSKHMELIYAHL